MCFAKTGVAGLLLVIGILGCSNTAAAKEPQREVVRLDLDTAVQPFSASYVVDGIHNAERTHADAVLLRIDTPGGTYSSMRKIVGAILASHVPVVCWVGPAGARAASAGTFILLACNVAAMAPGTNVGAAHPVGLRGEVLAEKITNDASAFIRSIAETRGRNADWAERSVRASVSASAQEAVRLHVADGVASSEADALRLAKMWPASVQREPIAFGRGLLGSLIDPNLAFLLFLIGIAGIIIEALHPGISVPGVVGVLSLVISLVMFEMLPVNIAGVVLLLIGIGFLIAELHLPGFGLPGIAGATSLLFGGLLLFDAGTLVRVSRPVLVGTVIGMTLFFLIVVRKALLARRQPPPVPHSLVGEVGVATTDLAPKGTVHVRSESFTAETGGETIEAGSRVLVVGEQGLKLKVDRTTEEGTS